MSACPFGFGCSEPFATMLLFAADSAPLQCGTRVSLRRKQSPYVDESASGREKSTPLMSEFAMFLVLQVSPYGDVRRLSLTSSIRLVPRVWLTCWTAVAISEFRSSSRLLTSLN